MRYGRVDANMLLQDRDQDDAGMTDAFDKLSEAGALNPLKIEVPRTGKRFSFEKLYANRSSEAPRFTVSYSAEDSSALTQFFGLLGVFLIAMAYVYYQKQGATATTVLLVSSGFLMVSYVHLYLNTPAIISVIGGSLFVVLFLGKKLYALTRSIPAGLG